MNIEKARDFFSDYYEETLEKGLRQSFEQKLKTDKQLQAEYDMFVQTMSELDSLKFEEIPVPIYLNARITAKLDDARTPVKKARGLVFYLPRFGIAAAAAAAIVGTIITIPKQGHGQVATSNLFGDGITSGSPSVAWPMESIQISGSGTTATLHYSSAKDRILKICDKNGKELRSISLTASQPFEQSLTNPNQSATLFEIQVSEGGPDELLAVPGTQRKQVSGNSSGSLTDFAMALADQYNKPIILESKNVSEPISWSFDNSEAKDAVDKAFDNLPLQEVQTSSGVLSLKDK